MHLLYAVHYLFVKQYMRKDFNEIQKYSSQSDIRRVDFRNFENGYYGNRNYETRYIYNMI